MKILILGVRGFIGRHTSEILEQFGHQIIKADIHTEKDSNYFKIDPELPNFELIFKNNNIDACINCTGAASVPLSFENPLHDYTLNTVRIAQILEAIRKVSAKTKFIHFSSAAVYGNPSCASAIKENSELIPLSPYGWHKRNAEEICREYSELFQLQTISLRIFSAYGPHLRKQLFWDVYQKSLSKSRIELFGTGMETRDFIYVEDIAYAVQALLQSGDFNGRAVNVASGVSTTIATATRLFLDALEVNNEVIFTGNERTGDPDHWKADISYLNSIGFEPTYDLRNGLGNVAKWLKKL